MLTEDSVPNVKELVNGLQPLRSSNGTRTLPEIFDHFLFRMKCTSKSVVNVF